MKLNRSLAISSSVHDARCGNILTVLQSEFPTYIFDDPHLEAKIRNRIYTPEATLLTMVLTATQEDKSLKNSVNLSYVIHQQRQKDTLNKLQEDLKMEKEADQSSLGRLGRPKKYKVQIPKSLEKEISLNTAAYSKARNRLPLELAEKLFSASKLSEIRNDYSHWYGRRVFIGDGTYLQMQDTKSIRKEFAVKYNGKQTQGYPQGLLEVIMERGTGQIHSFRLNNRHVSELELFHGMVDQVPSGSLLLLDDLYNSYEILAKCIAQGIDVLVPSKRQRNFEVIEELAPEDLVIKIKPSQNPRWSIKKDMLKEIILRRMVCKSPEGKEYVLLSTIVDKKIPKEEFQLQYLTRWDIEIGIREIKTIMDINILRSKSPEMALKELIVSLATYNLIRKVIYASIKDLPFSPEEDFIQKFYTINKDIFVDKKGRVYNKWSTGRKRADATNTE